MRLSPVVLSSLFPVAAFASQAPFIMSTTHISKDPFAFKEGADILSPKNLLELVRPCGAVANDAGDLAFVPVSKHSFQDKETHKSIYIAPLKENTASAQFPSIKDGDTFWLDSRTLGHVVTAKEGKRQELYAVSLKYEGQSISLVSDASTLVGTFPTSGLANFKYSPANGTLVFSAYVWPDTNLTTVEEQDAAFDGRGTTALVYDQLYVRHWDMWTGPKRSTLFTVGLKKGGDGKWVLQDKYIAPLKGTGHDTPVEPFGGAENYDVSATHIVYTTKDPVLNPALHTRQNIYIVPLQGDEAPRELTSGKQGATANPVFDKHGTKVAWTEMDEDGYEADRAKIVVYDLVKDVRFTLTPEWDRSAGQLMFSLSDESVIFTAEDLAHVKVFSIKIPPTPSVSDARLSNPPIPIALTHTHAASTVQPLSDGRVLFTQSSLTSPNEAFVLSGLDTPSKPLKVEQITRFSETELQGKDLDEGEQYWFEGMDGFTVQGWILKPKGFKRDGGAALKKKKWPVAFLIHGGPQGAWDDAWSTRWNPNVFAQQGYFVVMVNPTGSTSFGQEFTDRIAEHWGDRPFEDLQKGWKAALKLYPEMDVDRAVAAGASWGGYAINWIQGHPEFGFGFKALVCHDGVFDTRSNAFGTEELYFVNHDFGGSLWSEKGSALAEKWSPSNHVNNFSTPQLIFHGSRDYRISESEGIGCFNALQQRGVESRLVVFPDENHWVNKPENSLKWHYELFRWFAKHTGSD